MYKFIFIYLCSYDVSIYVGIYTFYVSENVPKDIWQGQSTLQSA